MSGVRCEVTELLCAFCMCGSVLFTFHSSVAVSQCCMLPLLTPSSCVCPPHRSCPSNAAQPTLTPPQKIPHCLNNTLLSLHVTAMHPALVHESVSCAAPNHPPPPPPALSLASIICACIQRHCVSNQHLFTCLMSCTSLILPSGRPCSCSKVLPSASAVARQ